MERREVVGEAGDEHYALPALLAAASAAAVDGRHVPAGRGGVDEGRPAAPRAGGEAVGVEKEEAEAARLPVPHRVGEEGDGDGDRRAAAGAVGGGELAGPAEHELHVGGAPVLAVGLEEEAQGEGVARGGGAAEGEVAVRVAAVEEGGRAGGQLA